jgi:hypothetical protein
MFQPLKEDEFNGRGFYYLASYKLKGTPGSPVTIVVDNSTRSEVVIHNLQTYSLYEVSVQSANSAGKSSSPVTTVTGYSGEGSKSIPFVRRRRFIVAFT